jgi:hypothetical protein
MSSELISGRGESGRVPRLDMMLPNFVLLDISDTKLGVSRQSLQLAQLRSLLQSRFDVDQLESNCCNEGIKIANSARRRTRRRPFILILCAPHITDMKNPYKNANGYDYIQFAFQVDKGVVD